MKKYFILFLIVFLFIKLEKARELRKRRHSFLLPAVFDFAPFEFGLDSGIDDLLDSNFRNFQKFAEERLKKIDLRNSTNSTGPFQLICFDLLYFTSTSFLLIFSRLNHFFFG